MSNGFERVGDFDDSYAKLRAQGDENFSLRIKVEVRKNYDDEHYDEYLEVTATRKFWTSEPAIFLMQGVLILRVIGNKFYPMKDGKPSNKPIDKQEVFTQIVILAKNLGWIKIPKYND